MNVSKCLLNSSTPLACSASWSRVPQFMKWERKCLLLSFLNLMFEHITDSPGSWKEQPLPIDAVWATPDWTVLQPEVSCFSPHLPSWEFQPISPLSRSSLLLRSVDCFPHGYYFAFTFLSLSHSVSGYPWIAFHVLFLFHGTDMDITRKISLFI